ncbi:MAG: outer membrane protein assembly factor BamE [Verrucomicrobiota bacterium]|nr:outer membrane protein assembly factor BamE [Verrucomicrobiota bacterium]
MRSRLSSPLLLLVCALLLGACQSGRRLTRANVDQVTEGMAKKQVESILGLPTTVEMKDSVAQKKTIYVYTQGADTTIITFKEDKVESKETTLTE